MNIKDKLILVGVVTAAHGIKGNVIIKSFTSLPKDLFKLPIIDVNSQPVSLKFIGLHKNGFICKIENCDSRDKAEELKKEKLYCKRSDLPDSDDEDEFYIEDLKGLDVLDESGNLIGVVTNIANYGAGDILAIKFNSNGEEEFFAFTKENFPKIEQGHVTLALPPSHTLGGVFEKYKKKSKKSFDEIRNQSWSKPCKDRIK